MNVTAIPYKTGLAFQGEGPPAQTSTPPNPLTASFRIPLLPSARLLCGHLARSMYPSATILETPTQGRCSYTLLVPEHGTILQFRPPTHLLDLDITSAASAIFPGLTPASTRLLAVINPAGSGDGVNPDLVSGGHGSSQILSISGCRTLLVYAHTLIDGVPLSSVIDLHPGQMVVLSDPQTQLASLVRSLARDYFARAYHHPSSRRLYIPRPSSSSSCPLPLPSPFYPSAPTNELPETLAMDVGMTMTMTNPLQTHLLQPLTTPPTTPVLMTNIPQTGLEAGPAGVIPKRRRIGFTLRTRMQWMRQRLPARFSPVLDQVWNAMDEIELGLPWVLTHGDLGGGNILVDFGDGDTHGGQKGLVRLKGLVDWAEGEWLPFGVGLYGLEEVLGRQVEDGRFEYYPCAEQLREVFWEELVAAVPELGVDLELRARVEKARLLGLLLWHGIAFDDGALNRVVEPGRDDEELQKLDLFLLGIDHHRNNTEPRPPYETSIFNRWPSALRPALPPVPLQGC